MKKDYSEKQTIAERCHVVTKGDSFVGVIVDSNGADINFPLGYNLSGNDHQLRKDIRNLLNVLSFFLKKEKVFQNESSALSCYVDFPVSAYLRIISDYISRGGYYIEKDTEYHIGARGKTNWKKTIKKQRPLVTVSGSFVFTTMTVVTENQNVNKLITQIHRFCVSESFEKLGWLFISSKPIKYSLPCPVNQALHVLGDSIWKTNEDAKKNLLKSMMDILRFLDNNTSDRHFYFGINDFAVIWEKMIDMAFGVNDKTSFLPRTRWLLAYGNEKEKKPLIPDTIMVYHNRCYIIDAKYYRYGISGNPDHLPNGSDINKQITYGEYVSNKNMFPSDSVFNAFIMPFNATLNTFGIEEHVAFIGEARGDWISTPKYFERIQGIVIDTRFLMFHFKDRSETAWKTLADCIEEANKR